MAQSSVGAGLGFITTVSTRVIERVKSHREGGLAILDAASEDVLRDASDRFADSLIESVEPRPIGEFIQITSNFDSAAAAIEATGCQVRWNYAKRPDEIPMIIQPVDARVKPVLLGRTMTSGEVYAQYGSKLADPNKLFTFGFRVPDFQKDKLVFTFWKNAKGDLWYAYLNVNDGQRNVNVNPDHPDDNWNEDNCVLVCQSFYSPPFRRSFLYFLN